MQEDQTEFNPANILRNSKPQMAFVGEGGEKKAEKSPTPWQHLPQ